ncbi:DUF5018 domain-containing protein, partial [Paenibacillus sp. N3.4]|uniref:DUF5018 domain-containing protein n=1 Tax=Paenibacillus sp. N3.4 TaxID=2603222 RepID=UPI001C9D1056
PVTYTVIAEDGKTKSYTVTVTVTASSAKDLTTFSFEGLSPAVVGTISGTNIALTVPHGTSVTSLVATFTSSAGSTVKVGTTTQVSGTTVNDFTSPVTYTVTAQDGTTKSYIVTVTIAASSAKDLSAFSFEGLQPAVVGTINGTNIALTVPHGTSVTSLVATYTSSAVSTVKVGMTAQVSGTTVNDFTSPVTYTVTAEDGTTKNYTVTVTVLASSAKDLTAFSFEGLSPAVVGTISGADIALTVPHGTSVTSLVATYTSSSGSTVKVGSTAQVSGTTVNDFTSSVTYIVTAQDGTTKSYTVTVTVTASSAKDLMAFSFEGLSPAVIGTIGGTDIALTVPHGTSVTSLVATFTSSAGSIVKVGTTAQVSGTTANDFTSPVTYTVIAEDGKTKSYTVTVTVTASSAKDLTT